MNEAIINKPKRKNIKLIILMVVAMAFAAFGVSYSSFFSVESQSTIQQIKAGVLDVILDNFTITTDDLYPLKSRELPSASTDVEDQGEPHSTISLLNDGNIDAECSITLVPDVLDPGQTAANYQYVIISIIDTATNSWHNFGTEEDPVYNTPLSTLENNGVYPIMRDIVEASSSKQYRVYFQLAENTPASEIGKLVYMKFIVKSMTVNGQIES